MIKLVALVKAKEGMSRDAFIKRYEEGHVPLIQELLPYHRDYRRSYIIPGTIVAPAHIDGNVTKPAFDAVAELWYDSQEQLDKFTSGLKGSVGRLVAEDEADLFDRTRIVKFEVEEFTTQPAVLRPRPRNHIGSPAVKRIIFLKKKPMMTREAFIDYYERNHVALALKLLVDNGHCVYADYRRNFPIPDGLSKTNHENSPASDIDFDVMTEMWFWTAADHQIFHDLIADPKIGAAFAADERNLFDRSALSIFSTDEFIAPPRNKS